MRVGWWGGGVQSEQEKGWLRVCCVLDRKAGHRSLARGMVKALSEARPVVVEEVEVPRWAGWWGKVLPMCWPLGVRLARARVEGRVDVVVSSGGNALWWSAALGRRWGAKVVFVGSRRRMPKESVAVWVHYDPGLELEGFLCLPVLPAPFGREDLEKAGGRLVAERGWELAERFLVVLVGGDGAGYVWGAEDGRLLGARLNALARSTGLRVLITTSRRTSGAFEEALRGELDPAWVADACWYHRGDERRVVAAYLGLAKGVLVSEDSMSMVQEAMMSGVAVVTLRPAVAGAARVHRDYLEKAVGRGDLKVVEVAAEWGGEVGEWLQRREGGAGDVAKELGRRVWERLEVAGQ